MNHIAIPVDQLAHSPIHVPFVCNKEFSYDDQGFLTYPYRVGIDLSKLEASDNLAADSLAPFIQAWLWFGLLGEVLYVGSREDRKQKIASWQEFVTVHPDGSRWICTDSLVEAVFAFRDRKAVPGRFLDLHTSRVDRCLEVAASAVDRIVSSGSFRRHLSPERDFERLPTVFKVLLSVQILIETLDTAFTYLNPHRLTYSAWRSFRNRGHVRLVDDFFRGPNKPDRCDIQLPVEWRLAYFVGFLTPLSVVEEKLLTTAKAPTHVSEPCRCDSIEVAADLIAPIWQRGNIPIFELKRYSDTQRSLSLAERPITGGSQFVAVSHVRRGGLGNWSCNALPYCQLSRIQQLANRVTYWNEFSSSAVPFWIDTLGLPLSGELKRLSLTQLHRIYRSATAVLVIDPSLISRRVSGLEDALIRIRYSLWMQRLWTIQEGALGKQLWFAFANQTLCLQTVLSDYEAKYPFPLLTRMNLWSLPFEAKFLESILACVDQDLKVVKDTAAANRSGENHVNEDQKIAIRRALRFGYLAFPSFRYFRTQEDLAQIMTVLHAVFQVYFDVTANALKTCTNRSYSAIVGDLHRFLGLLQQPTISNVWTGYYDSSIPEGLCTSEVHAE